MIDLWNINDKDRTDDLHNTKEEAAANSAGGYSPLNFTPSKNLFFPTPTQMEMITRLRGCFCDNPESRF